MSRRTQEEKDRRYHLNFRNPLEKTDAANFANKRGFDSLNAYFLFLYRQDKQKLVNEEKAKAVVEVSAYTSEAREDLSSE